MSIPKTRYLYLEKFENTKGVIRSYIKFDFFFNKIIYCNMSFRLVWGVGV